MSVAPLELPGPWTLEDLPDRGLDLRHYEVVDGALLVSPAPSLFHAAVSQRVFLALLRQAPAGWEAVFVPAMRLASSERIADAGVVRAGTPMPRGTLGFAPSDVGLVVEVVSPSTRSTDRVLKPREYAAAGIPWYWRVETDPIVEALAFELVDGTYVERARLVGVGTLPGLFLVDLDLTGFDES